MSVTFTKLFSSITESTVWCEPDRVRLVWITMLAMADKHGRVWGSVPGLANRARVPVEDTRAAITLFLEPDADSRTAEHEGRRLEPIDGGWRLLNYAKYRSVRDEEARKAYKAEKEAERRARLRGQNGQAWTKNGHKAESRKQRAEDKNKYRSPSAPVNDSEPKQAKRTTATFLDEDVESIWKLWPNKGGKQEGLQAIRKALAHLALTETAEPVKELKTRVHSWLAWHKCMTAAGAFVPSICYAQKWFNKRRYMDDDAQPAAETMLLIDGEIVSQAACEAEGWIPVRGDAA